MNLEGKAVVVTGGSRGLGAALGRRLAEAGARVVLVARNEQPLSDVARDLVARGFEAHALPFDVADKAKTYALAGAAAALVGPIDVLVHNASALGPTPLRLLLDTECEDLARVLEVNLVGPFRLTKAIAGAMALRGSGTILHVTSDASIQAYPTWGAYSVSKAALDHLARLWAAELDELGVKSFSVDPGEMNTRMHEDAVPGADKAALADPEDVARTLVGMLQHLERIPNGARLEAASWKEAP